MQSVASAQIISLFVSARTSLWSLAVPSAREPAPLGVRSAGMVGVCRPPPNVSDPPTAVRTAWTAAVLRSCWAPRPHPTSCLVLTCSTANSRRCTTAPRGKVGGSCAALPPVNCAQENGRSKNQKECHYLASWHRTAKTCQVKSNFIYTAPKTWIFSHGFTICPMYNPPLYVDPPFWEWKAPRKKCIHIYWLSGILYVIVKIVSYFSDFKILKKTLIS